MVQEIETSQLSTEATDLGSEEFFFLYAIYRMLPVCLAHNRNSLLNYSPVSIDKCCLWSAQ